MLSLYKSIPTAVRAFLIKGAVVFIVWKLLYHLWLQPTQLLDRPLVNMTAAQTAWGLNVFHKGAPYTHETVEHYHGLGDGTTEKFRGTSAWVLFQKRKILLIVPNCDALELMVLYAGFILCYPGKTKYKWQWILFGIVLIYFVNLVRCIGLVSIANSTLSNFLDFAHHYLFTILVYGFIFLLWVWYIKKNNQANHSSHVISK